MKSGVICPASVSSEASSALAEASRLMETARLSAVLLPDVCLSRGVFLDGMPVDDLPRPVEVIPTDGGALRRALETGSGVGS